MSFVTVRNIAKSFGGFQALDDVSFLVPEGGTLALLGPSGCGKTTMLRCLAGLEMPDQGFISIAGTTIFDAEARISLNPEHRMLGVVFQSYAVWPHMSVLDNVAFPLRVRGVKTDERRKRAMEILDIVGLAHLAERSATQLSGGQQQRVALGRALVHGPKLVLFDEALSNLDAALREQMRLELKALQDRLGFTALYVTHDQSEALALAETIVLMNAGRIDTAGPTRQVFMQHQTSFAARFFGLNVVDGSVLPNRDAAYVAFQREHVQLRAPGDRGNAPSLVLQGTVTTRTFQGLMDEYAIELAPGVSIRAFDRGDGFAPGEAVYIAIEERHLFQLDR